MWVAHISAYGSPTLHKLNSLPSVFTILMCDTVRSDYFYIFKF
jgi:hypothetical protein